MDKSRANLSSDERQEIADRIHLFYQLVDSGRAASTAALFTKNGRLIFGPGSPQPGSIEGDAIPISMAARERQTTAFTRHSVSNIAYARAEEGAISATYILILFRSDDATRSSVPSFVADVAETWVQDAGSWKIAERVVSPTFARN